MRSGCKFLANPVEDERKEAKHMLPLDEHERRRRLVANQAPRTNRSSLSYICSNRCCGDSGARGGEVTMASLHNQQIGGELKMTSEMLAQAVASDQSEAAWDSPAHESMASSSRRKSLGSSSVTSEAREKWQRALNDVGGVSSAGSPERSPERPSLQSFHLGEGHDRGFSQREASANEFDGQAVDAFADTTHPPDLAASAMEAQPPQQTVVAQEITAAEPKSELFFEAVHSDEAKGVGAKIVASRTRLVNFRLNGSRDLHDSDWEVVFESESEPASCMLSLELRNNGFGDRGSVAIAQWFGYARCPDLIHVNFRENDIGRRGAVAIAKALGGGNCPDLTTLWMQCNQIDDAGALALAEWVGNGHCQALALLGLSQNSIGDIGARALAAGLGQRHCPVLKIVGLARNNVGDEGAETLIKFLKKGCPHMAGLVLDGNPGISKHTMELVTSCWERPTMKEMNPRSSVCVLHMEPSLSEVVTKKQMVPAC